MRKISITIALILICVTYLGACGKNPKSLSRQPMSFSLTKISSPFMCSSENPIWLGGTDEEFYLVENYKGDYEDLKTIYAHMMQQDSDKVSLAGVNPSIRKTQWYRYSKNICDDTKGDVFSYELNAEQLKNNAYPLQGFFSYERIANATFYKNNENIYVDLKADISVQNFVQWVNLVQERGLEERGMQKTKSSKFSDPIYHLYNQDKTQHVEMHCKDWCHRFELSMK